MKPLNVNGKYNFEEKNVVLKFSNPKSDFSLVSISAEYVCNKTKIPETEFKDISGSYKYNFQSSGAFGEGKIYQFNVSKINRNILQNVFIVEILYIYLNDLASSIFSSKYSIKVRIEFIVYLYDSNFVLGSNFPVHQSV